MERVSPAEFEWSRESIRAMLGSALHAASGVKRKECEPVAAALENEVLLATVPAVITQAKKTAVSPDAKRGYLVLAGAVKRILSTKTGPFPDDIVAIELIRGKASEVGVVAMAMKGHPAVAAGPREQVLQMFVHTLLSADPRYQADHALALATATAIEASCYNATVRMSKELEEPPRRQWDEPAFVNLYSTRCGTINGLLDPASEACRRYGATLVGRLLSLEVDPAVLGSMSEREICPAATARERNEIARRAGQHVEEQESNLFRCPHCGERRSKYREVQRRSLDEAPDYICMCLNPACRHTFFGRS